MKKSPLRKTSKTHTNTWWRKKAVEVAKLIAKCRDNYRCVTCGKTADQGYQMHGSHILNEGTHHRMSVEPSNIMCQCAQCHMDWHGNPLLQHWFHDKFPTLHRDLIGMDKTFSQRMIKPNYENICKELREEYMAMIK